jgi:arylsulfatase A-like enzyme
MAAYSKFNRRDFLKLLALVSAGVTFSRFGASARGLNLGGSAKPNIIIILFDAMSARHLSLYGYERETTPNLARFAERAAVYHSHYSAGSFTTSGIASLLTGMQPWSHRAINLGGIVKRSLAGANIFRWIGEDYSRVAFAQNSWADLLLTQFGADVDHHLPITSFSYKSKTPIFSVNLPNDPVMAHYAVDEFLALNYKELTPLPGSFTLGSLSAIVDQISRKLIVPSATYPYGMPYNSLSYYFHNQVVFAGMRDTIFNFAGSSPIFGYFHLFSPHAPYAPTKDFTGIFPEIKVPYKPVHPLSYMRHKQKQLNEFRLYYDECIANVDAEFGTLVDALETAGILENSYVIVTSDHGEVFERGEVGHGTALSYNPVIHIPLLISAPKQAQRLDFYTPTSSTDVVPTLLEIAGRNLPPELEGKPLPGFGGQEEPHRSVFSIEAKESSAFLPLSTATLSLIKDGYHLIYYKGYSKYPEVFELYNLNDDIEEKHDIFASDTTAGSRIKEELLDALADADRPYQKR